MAARWKRANRRKMVHRFKSCTLRFMKRKHQTLKQINRRLRLSRKEVLRRAEANTIKLTGKSRF